MKTCYHCHENEAKFDVDDTLVCVECMGQYDNCVSCGALIHESKGYPLLDGHEIGFGWKGVYKMRCEECHKGM